MAERRMFTQKITESDAFLEMPLSTQALYFHLCMYADDDGFVKNPKRICRMVGCNEDDSKLLIAKSFVCSYETGVIVIKHWRMHNLLRKDRYCPTEYLEEKSKLYVKENGAYTMDSSQGTPLVSNSLHLATKWQPNGNQMAPQDSIGKYSIVKDSIEYTDTPAEETKTKRFQKPTVQEIAEYCSERKNNVNADKFFDYYESKGWVVGKSKMKDWKACVRTWESNSFSSSSAKISRDVMNLSQNDIDLIG